MFVLLKKLYIVPGASVQSKDNITLTKKSSDKKKKKLTKDAISKATDFKHVHHIGWDPDTGVNVSSVL